MGKSYVLYEHDLYVLLHLMYRHLDDVLEWQQTTVLYRKFSVIKKPCVHSKFLLMMGVIYRISTHAVNFELTQCFERSATKHAVSPSLVIAIQMRACFFLYESAHFASFRVSFAYS